MYLPGISRLNELRGNRATRPAVVDEDRCIACLYIVGVETGHGEVADDRVAWVAGGADNADGLAATEWPEFRTAGKTIGADPGMSARVPEQVVFGGDDDAGPVTALAVGVNGDLDGLLTARVSEGGDDRFGSGLVRFGSVASENLVAYLHLLDRLVLAVGEDDSGSRHKNCCTSGQPHPPGAPGRLTPPQHLQPGRNP